MATIPTGLAKEHDVSLDSNFLIPGTTYQYKIVSEDEKANRIEGSLQTFKTKGYTLKVTLLDKNKKPISKTHVTLFSDPINATTDEKGVVTFSDIPPGEHHLQYKAKGVDISKSLVVAANVSTAADGSQTAAIQSASVTLDNYAVQKAPAWLYVGALSILFAILAVLIVRGKGGNGPFKKLGSQKLITQPASSDINDGLQTTSVFTPSDSGESLSQRLNNVNQADVPEPGHVIQPKEGDNNNA